MQDMKKTKKELVEELNFLRQRVSELATDDPVTHIASEQDIINPVQTETTIKEINKRLEQERGMFTSGPVVIFKWQNRENWPVEYVSPNVKDMLGYSANEWMSGELSYSEIILDEDLERVSNEVRNFSESNAENFTHEPYRLRRKDGELIWVSDHTTALRDKTGEITHYLGYLLDITKRKQAENQVQQKTRDIALINALNVAANQGKRLPEIIQLLTKEIKNLLSVASVTLYLVSQDKKHLMLENIILPDKVRASIEKLVKKIPQANIPLKDGSLYLELLEADRIQTIEDTDMIRRMMMEHTETPALQKLFPQIQKLMRLRYIHVIPLTSNGEAIGLVNISLPEPMSESEMLRVETIISQLTGIIKRKQIERALQKSAERFTLVTSVARSTVWEFNIQTGEVYIEEIADMLGYSASEYPATAKTWQALVHPDDLQHVMETLQAHIEGRTPELISEYRVIAKDGTIHWLLTHGKVLHDKEGRALKLIGASADITERKEAEEALRSNREHYRLLEDNVTDVIWTLDMDLNLTYISPSVEQSRGYTVEEAMALSLEETLPPKSLRRVRKLFARAAKISQAKTVGTPRASAWSLEMENYCKDGSTIWVETRLSFMLNSKGEAMGIVGASRDITKHKKDREALRVSEERFRGAFENTSIGMSITTVDGEILQANEAFQDIIGYSIEELYKLTFWDFTHPDDIAANQVLVDELLAGERSSYQMEKRYIHKDGHVVWVFLDLVTIRDPEAKPLYSVVLTRDITEEREKEEALRESEERFRTLVENMPLGITTCNPEGDIIDINKAMLEILGSPSVEASRAINVFTFPPLRDAGISSLIRNCIERGESFREENSYTSKWGKTGDWYILATPIRNAEGDVILAQILVEDITERKQSEAVLLESEERFRSAFEIASIGITLESIEGRYLKVNQALCEMLGYSEAELLSLTFQELTHPDDLEGDLKDVDKLLSGEIQHYSREKRYIHKDGHIIWTLLNTSYVRNEEGGPLYAIALIENITERKQAREKLKQHQEHLESLVEERTIALQETNSHLSTLLETAFVLNTKLELEAVLDHILEQARGLMSCRALNIMLVQGEYAYISRRIGYEGLDIVERNLMEYQFPLSWPSFKQMNILGQSIFIEDTNKDPGWQKTKSADWVRSYIGVPLRIGNETLGFLNASDGKENYFTKSHVSLLEGFAQHAATALEKARLFKTEREYAKELLRSNTLLTSLSKVSARLSLTPNPDQVILAVEEELTRIGFISAVGLFDADTGDMTIHSFSIKSTMLEKITKLFGFSIIGYKIPRKKLPSSASETFQGQIVFARSTLQDLKTMFSITPKILLKRAMEFVGLPLDSAVSYLPLKMERRIHGVLAVWGSKLKEEDMPIFSIFTNQMAVALENAQLYANLEQALKQERETRDKLVLADKLSALGKMVAVIAHEINNPIQTIKNTFFLLEGEIEPNTLPHKYLKIAADETNRIGELVSQLRETYRLRSKTLARINLLELLDDVKTIMTPHLKKSGVAWEQPDKFEPCTVLGVRNNLKQVFINMTQNAVDAMEESGGGTITIQLHIDKTKHLIGVELHNTGEIIPPDDLTHIFDPFYTTKKDGSGLGLSITYDIIQQHKGDITVESDPEKGVAFTVWLPLAPVLKEK